MKRWCGWGEWVISVVPLGFKGAVKGTRCVAASIGIREVMAGHLGSERVVTAGGEVGVGSLTYCRCNNLQFMPIITLTAIDKYLM